jgi:hypothetical protein
MRSWGYWILGVLSTLLFGLSITTMVMVPGIIPSAKMWMLCVVGLAVAVSLGLGTWRFGSTEAPVMVRPFGPILAAILLVELIYCAIGMFRLVTGS